MTMLAKLESEVDRLVGLVDTEEPFDIPRAELLPRQLTAIGERFRDHVEQIKLLRNRAETGGVSEIRSMVDVVPLLFAHTAYKSYPESWLAEQKWDRLGRWLDTISTRRVEPMDTSDVGGLDDWLQRLAEREHYVACSSGTTGKCAMMNASAADLDFAGRCQLRNMIWSGLAPNRDRRIISPGQVVATSRTRATGKPMLEAYSRPDIPPFAAKVPPITIGGITQMVVLRKKIAEGTARPEEIAAYEAETAAREAAVESALQQAAEAVIESRHLPLLITGLSAPQYWLAERVRKEGYSGEDFQENAAFMSGGLKRAQVPPNHREFVYETLNITPERTCQAYGMQELNSTAPRCRADRYHMPPWVMLLLLDESGEELLEPPAGGEIEGRAGFFDVSLSGRWGGVISGDKVRATWEACACGRRSPSVDRDIQRYADLAGGDKIACAGTIDAYVRGEA